MDERTVSAERATGSPACESASRPACPVCGGRLQEMRTKLVCAACHTICETCCDGGRQG